MGPLSVTQEDNFVILWVQKLQLSCISSYTAEKNKIFSYWWLGAWLLYLTEYQSIRDITELHRGSDMIIKRL